MKFFLLQVFAAFFLLSFLFIILAEFLTAFPFRLGVAVNALMSLNVLGAVIPFYIWKKSNPILVYLIGMVVRLLLLGFALALLYYLFSQGRFLFFGISMIVYVLFQALEIRHLIKNKNLFNKSAG